MRSQLAIRTVEGSSEANSEFATRNSMFATLNSQLSTLNS